MISLVQVELQVSKEKRENSVIYPVKSSNGLTLSLTKISDVFNFLASLIYIPRKLP